MRSSSCLRLIHAVVYHAHLFIHGNSTDARCIIEVLIEGSIARSARSQLAELLPLAGHSPVILTGRESTRETPTNIHQVIIQLLGQFNLKILSRFVRYLNVADCLAHSYGYRSRSKSRGIVQYKIRRTVRDVRKAIIVEKECPTYRPRGQARGINIISSHSREAAYTVLGVPTWYLVPVGVDKSRKRDSSHQSLQSDS
jgi:hypothetical protein